MDRYSNTKKENFLPCRDMNCGPLELKASVPPISKADPPVDVQLNLCGRHNSGVHRGLAVFFKYNIKSKDSTIKLKPCSNQKTFFLN